ncbi:S41 family peptidase [Syntrophomonas curvata]
MLNKYQRAGVLLLGLFFILGSLCPAAAADDKSVCNEAAEIIEDNYVEPVSQDVLTAPTVKEMLKRLGDPYARYLTQEEYQEQLDSLDGNFTGVGIYITGSSEGVRILSVIKGSPAEKAGLRKDDVIVAAGEASLAGLDSDRAMEILRGSGGSTVTLEVKRGEQLLTVDVTRDNVEVPTVHLQMLDKETAYLGIDDFGQRTLEELEAAAESLKKEKASKWIVDLRGNPGGYLETAIDAAGVFMGEQPAVLVEERSTVDGYMASPASVVIEGPLVLLQDEYSASAAEMLAAALRDNQRALLIGKKTYGKGTVQQIFPLSNGDKLKLTIARFYSPAGEEINKVGIMPDIEVEDENCLAAASLLLSDNRDVACGSMIGLDLERYKVAVDGRVLRQARYWKAWADIVDGIGESPVCYGNESGWTELSDTERGHKWSFFYPGYEYMGEISEQDGIEINMKSVLNERYVNDFNIELINAGDGKRIKSDLQVMNEKILNCRPLEPLTAGEYWLVIHDTIRFADGQRLPQGQLAVVRIP